jgi:hypothetical protein
MSQRARPRSSATTYLHRNAMSFMQPSTLRLAVKGGNTLSNSRELVIAAVGVTLPDASADIPPLPQRPYCLPLQA